MTNRWERDYLTVWAQFNCPAIPKFQVLPEEYEENVKGIFLLSPYFIEPNRQEKMRARMDEYVDICRRHCGRIVAESEDKVSAEAENT